MLVSSAITRPGPSPSGSSPAMPEAAAPSAAASSISSSVIGGPFQYSLRQPARSSTERGRTRRTRSPSMT